MLQKNIFRDKGSAMSFSLEYTGDFHGKSHVIFVSKQCFKSIVWLFYNQNVFGINAHDVDVDFAPAHENIFGYILLG